MTTARKAVTLLLSYMIFTKPLTEQHVTGLLLITMGIVMKMLPDNRQASRSPSSDFKIQKESYGEVKRIELEKFEAEDEENRGLV